MIDSRLIDRQTSRRYNHQALNENFRKSQVPACPETQSERMLPSVKDKTQSNRLHAPEVMSASS
jgi:hypothetical protein